VLAAHVVGIVVAAPATLVLTWSHDTFEVLMHVLSIYRFIYRLLETPRRLSSSKERLSAGVFAGASTALSLPGSDLAGSP
jgi:hypothetical protein